MATIPGGDDFLRCVYDGCLSTPDREIERRPYHRNCSCALHRTRSNKGTHTSHRVSFRMRRACSESCLVWAASSWSNVSPGWSPGNNQIARPGNERKKPPPVLSEEGEEEDDDSKGIHRALIPLDSHMENITGVELAESSSSYRMLTQMDILRFLKAHGSKLNNVISRTVEELGAITEDVYAVTSPAKVIEAIKCMRAASLTAVPIVEPLDSKAEDHSQLLNGRGRKVIGTFSATDLRGCPISDVQSWLGASVLEFTRSTSTGVIRGDVDMLQSSKELVTCSMSSSLSDVIDKAVDGHVHRVWVVDAHGLLLGIVSITDILRVIRSSSHDSGMK